jgi:hypothetical protein
VRAYLTLFSDVLTQPSRLAAIPLKPFFADRNQLKQSFFYEACIPAAAGRRRTVQEPSQMDREMRVSSGKGVLRTLVMSKVGF